MIEDKNVVEYKVIVSVEDKKMCADLNSLGFCYVDDCMRCSNSRIKIIREDGKVMRDDIDQNDWADETICSFRRCMSDQDEAINTFEEMYDTKLSLIQRWHLKCLLKKLKSNYYEKI